MYAEMEKAGVSWAGRQKAGKALRNALEHATASDLIPKNPAALVPLPRREEGKRSVAPLEEKRAGRLLATAARDRLYAIHVLALAGGMRQGELFALRWPDIDFDRGEVSISNSLEERRGELQEKETKTKHGRRRVTRATLDALHEHRKLMLAEGHMEAPVICDTDGGFLRKSNFQRRSFDPALRREAAGKPKVRFHDLRHTCATLLLLEEVNAKIVSERLGHASIEITLNTYSHALPTLQERAAEKLEGVMGRMVPARALS